MISGKLSTLLVLSSLAFVGFLTSPALAQSGVPVPGSASGQAPLPGAMMNMPQSQGAISAYHQLPISASDAQTRLAELKIMLDQGTNKSIQESIYQYCDWLADMADAHNKLANSFTKFDATKPMAEAEKQSAHKFQQLRYQALLLKAKLMIKECRFPEALEPLVEIVVAEPRSATGLEAYQQLKEIGFAEDVEIKPEVKANTGGAKPGPVINPVAKTGSPAPKATATSPAQKGAELPGKASTIALNVQTAPKTALQVAAPSRLRAVERSTSSCVSHHSTVWMSGTPFGDGGAASRAE